MQSDGGIGRGSFTWIAVLLLLVGGPLAFSTTAQQDSGFWQGEPDADHGLLGPSRTGSTGGEEPRGTYVELPRGPEAAEQSDHGSPVWSSQPAPAPTPLFKSPGEHELEFECRSPLDGESGYTVPGVNVLYGCPIRVYDGGVAAGVATGAGYPFGNIQLVVHPDDPDQAAFFTLHGSSARDEGRTESARTGLTHTTFTTTTGGLSWGDHWTESDYPSSDAYGEWASGTMDSRGQVYGAFLWNRPAATGQWDSTVALFKGPKPVDYGIGRNIQPYQQAFFLDTRDQDNVITRSHIAFVPAPEQDEPDNETGPQAPGEIGEAAVDRNETDLVAMAWYEYAVDWENSTTGMSGWIDMMWTDTGSGNTDSNWTFLADDELIGPCRGISDIAAYDGGVYVACIVERGYDARTRANVGDVDLWRIDPFEGTSELVGYTGIDRVDHVVLTATPDGYFAIAGSRVVQEHEVDVKVSLGWYGRSWNLQGQNIGRVLHNSLGEIPLRDAHVTALAVTQDEKTVFMTYKEWNDVEEPTLRPGTELPRLRDYKKAVVSLNECSPGPIAGAEFHMGELAEGYQRDAWEDEAGIFNDHQDGLHYARLPDGRERVFMAINDYGAAQFAAIVPSSAVGDAFCPITLPIPPPPAAAIPQAVGMGTGAQTAVGSAVGLLSLAMISYLLTVKRKNPFASVAEAR